MKKALITPLPIFLFFVMVMSQPVSNPKFYLNETPPDLVPILFAPDFFSANNEYEFGSVFNKEADKFYYGVRLNDDWKAEIRYTELKNGNWTKPIRVLKDTIYTYNDPYISDDGKRLYFVSDRQVHGKRNSTFFDIWYVEIEKDGWSEPKNMGYPPNSERGEFYISISDSGSAFFVSNAHAENDSSWDYDVHYSKSINGSFQHAVNLGNSVNSAYFECDPFIAADESYLIFSSSRPGGHGQGDLYISFRKDNNTWTEAKNLGDIINSENHEFCPVVSRDGNYLFFTSNGDIYWVDSKIIEDYR